MTRRRWTTLFAEDIAKGVIENGLDVTDVWPENYSTNSVQKVWAAKYASRHPNLACLDLSSFKCGHDAPTYGLIDSIIASAGKAYSALHDIDANKPSGSIKIRVKTYAHTLMLLKREARGSGDQEGRARSRGRREEARADEGAAGEARRRRPHRRQARRAKSTALDAQVARVAQPKKHAKARRRKRSPALNVIKDGSGAGSSAAANLAKARQGNQQ